MKKIYLILAGLAGVFGANAQRNLTLKCEIVNPTYNQNITTSSSVSFSYKITNNSATAADSLAKGDTIKIFDPASKYDGTKFTTYSGDVVLTSSIPKGGTLTITPTTPLPFASIETLADPADGNKYKSKSFTNNKQYSWFFTIYAIGVPSTNVAISSSSTVQSDTGLVWINKSTGLAEFASTEALTIKTYPNPAVNQLSFDYNFESNATATVSVLDINGRTVMTKVLENVNGTERVDLNVTSVPSGMYMLRLDVGEKSVSAKFSVLK